MASVPSFMIIRWPDAIDEYQCDMKEVMFDDGKKRIICTNKVVPDNQWPNDVYQKNESGGYDSIGKYVMKWEGTPSVQIYKFITKKGGSKKTRSNRRRGRKLRRRTRKH